jgi:hypothetical protein
MLQRVLPREHGGWLLREPAVLEGTISHGCDHTTTSAPHELTPAWHNPVGRPDVCPHREDLTGVPAAEYPPEAVHTGQIDIEQHPLNSFRA